jgi:nucleoside-diphosphate-sugar epimerase
VSSVAAVGKSLNKKPISEENEWDIEQSNYGYAITKYGAEMEVWRASQEGVPVIIVNPGVILGAGFWTSGSGQLFSKINSGMKFYTEGTAGYVSVNDVVKIMLQLMKSSIENERYILVAENVSYKIIFTEIAENLGKKPPSIKISKLMSAIGWRLDWLKSLITGNSPMLTKQTAKTIHQKRNFSSEKIKKALNYQFEPVAETIKKVSDNYKKDADYS